MIQLTGELQLMGDLGFCIIGKLIGAKVVEEKAPDEPIVPDEPDEPEGPFVPPSITLAPTNPTPVFAVRKGKTFDLSKEFVIVPGTGNKVVFETSDAAVMTVDSTSGVITGVSKGVAIVTITILNKSTGAMVFAYDVIVSCA